MKRFLIFWRFLVFGLVIVLSAGQVGPVHAATLQEMINAAPDGGTVTIPAGDYYETLTVDKNLTLVGASSTTTILHPDPNAWITYVISVSPTHSLTLRSLQITGAFTRSGYGGGVSVTNGSLTLISCIIADNRAWFGAGVFQGGAGGSLTAIDSVFIGNRAIFSGGGLYAEGNVFLTNTNLTSNNANNEYGGGLYAEGSANLTNTNLTGNTSGLEGGGMYAVGSGVTLTGGVISGNSATTGSGGGAYVDRDLTIDGTQFSNNTAGLSGGGLAQHSPQINDAIIRNANFNGNTAVDNGGGAFIASHLDISNTTFIQNSADINLPAGSSGGGLYAGQRVDGSHLTFQGNSATYGGGLFSTHPIDEGNATIDQSMFAGNLAKEGGAIFASQYGRISITNSTIINNHADSGGGTASWELDGDRVLFQNNTANIDGGAATCYVCGVTNSRFINNAAGSGGGGAINTVLIFSGENLLFDRNASPQGAALAVQGTASLHYATIARLANYNQDPAIMMTGGSTLDLRDTIISSYWRAVTGAGTLTEDYNLFYNNSANFSGVTVTSGGHSISGQNPLFADPAAGDYRLTTLSPARKKGINLGLAYDINGTPRTDPPDIGAYQSWLVINLPAIMR